MTRPIGAARRLLFAIAAAGIGLVGAVVLLEAGLRIATIRRPRNDWQTWTWGKRIRLNRMNLRERTFAVPRPEGTLRVMALGDSFTWGVGLDEGERWTTVLERKLAAELPGRRVEVLNFGRSAASTKDEAETLRQFLLLAEPDVVVLGFCVNDPQTRLQEWSVELERYAPLFRRLERLQSFRLHRTYEFLHQRLDRALRSSGRVPEWPDALERAYDPKSPEWATFTRSLGDIRALTVGSGLPDPIFAAFPYGDGDFTAPDDFLRRVLRWCRLGREAAGKAGFQTVDLEPAFLADGRRVRAVNRWDNHPDAACNRLYAEALFPPVLHALRKAGDPSSVRWGLRRALAAYLPALPAGELDALAGDLLARGTKQSD